MSKNVLTAKYSGVVDVFVVFGDEERRQVHAHGLAVGHCQPEGHDGPALVVVDVAPPAGRGHHACAGCRGAGLGGMVGDCECKMQQTDN